MNDDDDDKFGKNMDDHHHENLGVWKLEYQLSDRADAVDMVLGDSGNDEILSIKVKTEVVCDCVAERTLHWSTNHSP